MWQGVKPAVDEFSDENSLTLTHVIIAMFLLLYICDFHKMRGEGVEGGGGRGYQKSIMVEEV